MSKQKEKRHRLEEKIAEEERLVRLYEAQLDLLEQNQQEEEAVPQFQPFRADQEENDGEEDLWETLTALQFSDTTPSAARIDTQWQDDPVLYRLLPLVSGGIVFTSVQYLPLEPSLLLKSTTTKRRTYQLQGYLLDSLIGFFVTATVELTPSTSGADPENPHNSGGGACVVALKVKFAPHHSNDQEDTSSGIFPREELDQVATLATSSRNLPLVFRQMQGIAALEQERTHLVREIACLERGNNATILVLDSRLVLEYKVTSCGWSHGQGRPALSVVDFLLPPTAASGLEETLERRRLVETVRDPQGLQHLLACTGGSCPDAIRLLSQVLSKHN